MQIEFELIWYNRRVRSRPNIPVVAAFQVLIFPFRICDCEIHRQKDGSSSAFIPGLRHGPYMIVSKELRDAIKEEAIAQYLERMANDPRAET